MNDVLWPALRGGYCVPAFDCVPDIYTRALLDAAEQARSPVILSILPADLHGVNGHHSVGLIQALAPAYTVPIVLHLDHATCMDDIKLAIHLGCNAVMIDGSHLPFADNVALTSQVCGYAHARGVTVEAELGHVAGSELATGADTGASVLTNPAEVKAFVEATQVDALAVSIGTAHGVYVAQPQLNIPVLKQIHAACPIPLVLHGGSGVPADQLHAAINHGITKLNIYADLRLAMNQALPQALAVAQERPDATPETIFHPLAQAITTTALSKITICQSAGRI